MWSGWPKQAMLADEKPGSSETAPVPGVPANDRTRPWNHRARRSGCRNLHAISTCRAPGTVAGSPGSTCREGRISALAGRARRSRRRELCGPADIRLIASIHIRPAVYRARAIARDNAVYRASESSNRASGRHRELLPSFPVIHRAPAGPSFPAPVGRWAPDPSRRRCAALVSPASSRRSSEFRSDRGRRFSSSSRRCARRRTA